MLTGWFAARKAEQEKGEERAAYKAMIFTWKKFLRLYPYVIPAVLIHYLVTVWLRKLTLLPAIKLLFYGSLEMLLLQESGICETFLLAPLWYLSALLIVLPLFYYAAMKCRDAFFFLISPLSILLIYGYFSVTYTHVDIWWIWTGCFYLSHLRAWSGLCLGGLCYLLSQKIKEFQFIRRGRGVKPACFQYLCLAGILYYMYTGYHQRLDFFCVGAEFLFLAITLSKTKISHRTKTRWNFLAEYSLALYVSHWTIKDIISSIMAEATYKEMLLPYLLASLLYAGIFAELAKSTRLVRKLNIIFRFEKENS